MLLFPFSQPSFRMDLAQLMMGSAAGTAEPVPAELREGEAKVWKGASELQSLFVQTAEA